MAHSIQSKHAAGAPKKPAAVAAKATAAVAPKETAAVAPKQTAAVATTAQYCIHPEYIQPEDVTDASTEKDAPATRLWKYSGNESMYPFWAVENKTAELLRGVRYGAQSIDVRNCYGGRGQ